MLLALFSNICYIGCCLSHDRVSLANSSLFTPPPPSLKQRRSNCVSMCLCFVFKWTKVDEWWIEEETLFLFSRTNKWADERRVSRCVWWKTQIRRDNEQHANKLQRVRNGLRHVYANERTYQPRMFGRLGLCCSLYFTCPQVGKGNTTKEKYEKRRAENRSIPVWALFTSARLSCVNSRQQLEPARLANLWFAWNLISERLSRFFSLRISQGTMLLFRSLHLSLVHGLTTVTSPEDRDQHMTMHGRNLGRWQMKENENLKYEDRKWKHQWLEIWFENQMSMIFVAYVAMQQTLKQEHFDLVCHWLLAETAKRSHGESSEKGEDKGNREVNSQTITAANHNQSTCAATVAAARVLNTNWRLSIGINVGDGRLRHVIVSEHLSRSAQKTVPIFLFPISASPNNSSYWNWARLCFYGFRIFSSPPSSLSFALWALFFFAAEQRHAPAWSFTRRIRQKRLDLLLYGILVLLNPATLANDVRLRFSPPMISRRAFHWNEWFSGRIVHVEWFTVSILCRYR